MNDYAVDGHKYNILPAWNSGSGCQSGGPNVTIVPVMLDSSRGTCMRTGCLATEGSLPPPPPPGLRNHLTLGDGLGGCRGHRTALRPFAAAANPGSV